MPTVIFNDTTTDRGGPSKGGKSKGFEWNDLTKPSSRPGGRRPSGSGEGTPPKKAHRRCCPGPGAVPLDLQSGGKLVPSSPTASMGSSLESMGSSLTLESACDSRASNGTDSSTPTFSSSTGEGSSESLHGQWMQDVLAMDDPLAMTAGAPAPRPGPALGRTSRSSDAPSPSPLVQTCRAP